ncbi:hypothetical protein CRUP_022439 [Coryphaenoides rupestris]|nr:hypothetical protein CRUP_022439 [Coryphaenoides rupestris]
MYSNHADAPPAAAAVASVCYKPRPHALINQSATTTLDTHSIPASLGLVSGLDGGEAVVVVVHGCRGTVSQVSSSASPTQSWGRPASRSMVTPAPVSPLASTLDATRSFPAFLRLADADAADAAPVPCLAPARSSASTQLREALNASTCLEETVTALPFPSSSISSSPLPLAPPLSQPWPPHSSARDQAARLSTRTTLPPFLWMRSSWAWSQGTGPSMASSIWLQRSRVTLKPRLCREAPRRDSSSGSACSSSPPPSECRCLEPVTSLQPPPAEPRRHSHTSPSSRHGALTFQCNAVGCRPFPRRTPDASPPVSSRRDAAQFLHQAPEVPGRQYRGNAAELPWGMSLLWLRPRREMSTTGAPCRRASAALNTGPVMEAAAAAAAHRPLQQGGALRPHSSPSPSKSWCIARPTGASFLFPLHFRLLRSRSLKRPSWPLALHTRSTFPWARCNTSHSRYSQGQAGPGQPPVPPARFLRSGPGLVSGPGSGTSSLSPGSQGHRTAAHSSPCRMEARAHTADTRQSLSLVSLLGSPCTLLRCCMARWYASCTDLRMLDLRPSSIFSLSSSWSTPSGTSLERGSHCLRDNGGGGGGGGLQHVQGRHGDGHAAVEHPLPGHLGVDDLRPAGGGSGAALLLLLVVDSESELDRGRLLSLRYTRKLSVTGWLPPSKPWRTRELVFVVAVALRAGAGVRAPGPLPLPRGGQQGELRGADGTGANPCAPVAAYPPGPRTPRPCPPRRVPVLGGPAGPLGRSGRLGVLLGEEDGGAGGRRGVVVMGEEGGGPLPGAPHGVQEPAAATTTHQLPLGQLPLDDGHLFAQGLGAPRLADAVLPPADLVQARLVVEADALGLAAGAADDGAAQLAEPQRSAVEHRVLGVVLEAVVDDEAEVGLERLKREVVVRLQQVPHGLEVHRRVDVVQVVWYLPGGGGMQRSCLSRCQAFSCSFSAEGFSSPSRCRVRLQPAQKRNPVPALPLQGPVAVQPLHELALPGHRSSSSSAGSPSLLDEPPPLAPPPPPARGRAVPGGVWMSQ